MSIKFLQPQILWGLTVLLIPIIIHLFNFKKYKKVYFSNISFLKNLNVENRRKSKLQRLLILLLRMLAVASIVIAFAQPYLPGDSTIANGKLEEIINIYIDNSFSMNAETENGTTLEVAKNKAFTFINSLPESAKIKIFSNDIRHNSNALSKPQAISRIQDIEPSPVQRKLSEQLKQIKIDNQNSFLRTYLFSDFQENQCDIENIQADSNQHITFLPIDVNLTNNISLDSCWLKKTNFELNQVQEVCVRVQNHSNITFEKIPLELQINDSLKSVTNFNIDANSSKIVELKYLNKHLGHYRGKVSLSDFPVTFDNTLYFSYQIDSEIKILAINKDKANSYLNSLFSSSKQFNFENSSKSQAFNKNLENFKLIILNEIQEIESGFQKILTNYISNGGVLLFIPSKEEDKIPNNFLSEILTPTYTYIDSNQQRISRVELNSDLYKNVFEEIEDNSRLPDVFKYYKMQKSDKKLGESIWETANGDPLFYKSIIGKGSIYQFAMPLTSEHTNLITHPIFVPTLINLGKSLSNNAPIYQAIQSNNVIKSKVVKNPIEGMQYHISNKELNTDIIPEQQVQSDRTVLLKLNNRITRAGNYIVNYNDSIISHKSLNYTRKESELEYLSSSTLRDRTIHFNGIISVISPSKLKLSGIYNEQSNGKQYWKMFIILCILSILAESIIQKVRKQFS